MNALILLIIGGAIAFIGNYIGRLIGKRRLTLFGLRPRHTATIITILSGVLVALTTAAIILILSQDARTAIFGLKQLKAEIAARSEELRAARRAAADLQRVKERLAREIKAAREGQVLYKVDDVIALALIQAGPDREKVEAGLRQIINAAEGKVLVSDDEFEQVVETLLEQKGLFVARLLASRNALYGEVVPARLELSVNQLIYQAGELIADLDIPTGFSAPAVEQEITRLLELARQRARAAGVLPDVSGSLGSVSYAQIFDLAKKIRQSTKLVNLQALAGKAIYSIGPLNVKFQLGYK